MSYTIAHSCVAACVSAWTNLDTTTFTHRLLRNSSFLKCGSQEEWFLTMCKPFQSTQSVCPGLLPDQTTDQLSCYLIVACDIHNAQEPCASKIDKPVTYLWKNKQQTEVKLCLLYMNLKTQLCLQICTYF